MACTTINHDPSEWLKAAAMKKEQRRNIPPEFSKQWLQWWVSLQPLSRKSARAVRPSMELPHVRLPDHADWNPLRKGGPRGMCLLVEGLGICYCAIGKRGGMSMAEWHRWVSDVHWVLNEMLGRWAEIQSPYRM